MAATTENGCALPILKMNGNAVAYVHKFGMGEQGQAFIAQMHYCFATKLFETGEFPSQKSSAQYFACACYMP